MERLAGNDRRGIRLQRSFDQLLALVILGDGGMRQDNRKGREQELTQRTHLEKYHWPNPTAKKAGSHRAAKYDMRRLVTFMLIAGVGGGLFLWQKQNQQTTAAVENSGVQKQSVTAKTELTPAPRGQASEYNWMKRSLDRAADVRDQARARTKEAQDP